MKWGKDSGGNQRYRCQVCRKTTADRQPSPTGPLRMDVKEAAFALRLLLEGMSIRATERITGIDKNRLCNLVAAVGKNCDRFLSRTLVGLKAKDVEVDEMWGFVACKEKNRPRGWFGDDMGDAWTFLAVERTTKLILAHHVGRREAWDTQKFVRKIERAVAGRTQITTDGYAPYRSTVPAAFGRRADYGVLVKNYRALGTGAVEAQRRYSPAEIVGIKKVREAGRPDPDRISTSMVERTNLTVRMQVRRMTRLTNAHSKKWENHEAMTALFVAWFNFCRKHETVKATPAVAHGVASEAWSVERLLTEAAA
jgi:IS1 family transposase